MYVWVYIWEGHHPKLLLDSCKMKLEDTRQFCGLAVVEPKAGNVNAVMTQEVMTLALGVLYENQQASLLSMLFSTHCPSVVC